MKRVGNSQDATEQHNAQKEEKLLRLRSQVDSHKALLIIHKWTWKRQTSQPRLRLPSWKQSIAL